MPVTSGGLRLVCFCLIFALAPPASPQVEFFETRIRPLLAANCYSCHDSNKATSGLDLTSKAGLVRSGSRGTAVRVCGQNMVCTAHDVM